MMDSLPPMFPGRVGQMITILQLVVVLSSYANERNPETRAQYSKFSQAGSGESSQTKKTTPSSTWPSKLAMFVIYAPALVASVVLLVLGSKNDIYNELSFSVPKPSIAAYLCAIHFAKRVAEVLFLHHYSGRTDIGTPIMIGVFYTLITTLVAYAGGMSAPLAADVFGGNDNARDMIGVSVFTVGILGNFYHHYLLAKLRSSSKQNKSATNGITAKTYVAPRGGLFNYCAAPHYFFELIGWAGVAIVSNHLNVYLAFAGMTSYLAGRSVAQNDFNCTRFKEKDWPRDRKNLVPFVF
mmetsp:Transcript_22669/g.38758  ORF Transcript_22669/g.38758 Transcript_22669/m.38758 type:complete len:296 (-) Transcript_22669:64-951(-)